MRPEKKQKNNSENHSPNLLCTLGRQLSNPERKVLQMQKESTGRTACLSAEDEDLIDTLIAISVVAKRLAGKLKKEMEGESQDEQNE